MCGIVGCIGRPIDHALTHLLITNLLRETQIRGAHATGHFLVDESHSTKFYKLGIPAKVYTQLPTWRSLENDPYKAIIAHARYSTKGNYQDNMNNHPFVSTSSNIGLIHNGTLYESYKHRGEYRQFLHGVCDSELLLQVIVRENNIMKGIRKVFELFGEAGDFACLLLYRDPVGHAKTFFFRDSGRPARFIDASNLLGQYFFCSTTSIWKKAIADHPLKDQLNKLPVIIVPPYEIWTISAETMRIEKQFIIRPARKISHYTNAPQSLVKVVGEDGTIIWKPKKPTVHPPKIKDFQIKQLLLNPQLLQIRKKDRIDERNAQFWYHGENDMEDGVVEQDGIVDE